jgi:hypothetical protein
MDFINKIDLTKDQAKILKRFYKAKKQAEAQLHTALVLVGVDPSMISGGDMDADPPYLTTKTPVFKDAENQSRD